MIWFFISVIMFSPYCYYPASRDFSLAWLLAFTKPLACVSRSWFVLIRPVRNLCSKPLGISHFLAYEQQRYFRERSDDRKYVCCSQATLFRTSGLISSVSGQRNLVLFFKIALFKLFITFFCSIHAIVSEVPQMFNVVSKVLCTCRIF